MSLYLIDDATLTSIADAVRDKDGTSSPIVVSSLPDRIRAIQTGSSDVPFKFGGLNATLIDTVDKSWSMSDTSFVSGTTAPSSATSIKAAVSKSYTGATRAWGNSDILVFQRVKTTPVHAASATGARQLMHCYDYISCISKSAYLSGTTKRENYTRRVFSGGALGLKYYTSSNALAYTNTSYGIYATPSAAAVASATAASTYVYINSPVTYARYSSTYETSTNMKLITGFDVEWHVEVYELTSQSLQSRALYDDVETTLGVKV